jgi:hypothetical protein
MRILAVQRMAGGEHPNDVAVSFGMHRSWAYKVRAQARGRGRGVRALRSSKGTGRPRNEAWLARAGFVLFTTSRAAGPAAKYERGVCRQLEGCLLVCNVRRWAQR